MIVLLLLVIIAIMLFGATAIRNAIGTIIVWTCLIVGGTIAIVAAQSIPAWFWWAAGVASAGFLAWAFHEHGKAQEAIRQSEEAVRQAKEKQREVVKGMRAIEEAQARLARHKPIRYDRKQ